jgi:hypothetical protein
MRGVKGGLTLRFASRSLSSSVDTVLLSPYETKMGPGGGAKNERRPAWRLTQTLRIGRGEKNVSIRGKRIRRSHEHLIWPGPVRMNFVSVVAAARPFLFYATSMTGGCLHESFVQPKAGALLVPHAALAPKTGALRANHGDDGKHCSRPRTALLRASHGDEGRWRSRPRPAMATSGERPYEGEAAASQEQRRVEVDEKQKRAGKRGGREIVEGLGTRKLASGLGVGR